jgi:hypothetical protein
MAVVRPCREWARFDRLPSLHYGMSMTKMSKSEVFSWRLSPALKADLEAAARAEKTNVTAILERLVRDWLATRRSSEDEDAEQQRRLRERVLGAVGTVSIGGPSATNKRVREVMGEYLEKKHRASQRRAPRRPD